ncbi:MAG TPA: VLRF1 family aeRF1-type release factor [Candidatus Sulfotelmatobacter sp.]|nr:VLRF1 family aeRF1-type release factor [Candidatus Sulfotelmatobacter sp.]
MQNRSALSFEELPQPLLTVYLDTNPGESENQRGVPAYTTWLKAEAKTIALDLPLPERKLFREQLGRVEGFLKDQRNRNRGVLLFAGPTTWKELPLSLPVKNELHWGKPALSQLLAIVDEQKPCCIVAVDRAGARYFRHYLGEMEEFPEQKFLVDISQWKEKEHAHMARQGTRMPHGPQRDAFKQRVDEEYRHLYRQTAERIKHLCAREPLLSIFLVGSKRAIEPIEAELPWEFRARVMLVDKDLTRISSAELQRYMEPVIAARAREVMRKRVNDLMDRDHGTVVGLDETLTRIQAGTVSTVVVVRSLEAVLHKCLSCGTTNRTADPICACGGKMKRVMLSEILGELAHANRTEIEVASGEAATRLSKVGGIGGWLRPRRRTREAASTRTRL